MNISLFSSLVLRAARKTKLEKREGGVGLGITRGGGSATLRLVPGYYPGTPPGLRILGGAHRYNHNLQLPGEQDACTGRRDSIRYLLLDIRLPALPAAAHDDTSLPQLTALNRAQPCSIALKKYILQSKETPNCAPKRPGNQESKRFD